MEEGPDQIWSWVVAFACFFISFIMYGLFRATGIFLVAFINEFGESREDSSWPIFLLFSTQDLTGLVVGPLGQKCGIRPIVIVGSLISAVGVSLCFFAKSLLFLTIFFGVTCGVGYGLTATLTSVIVNDYFLKYRVTANGIANSGICFGSIVFPTVYEYLLSTYGFNGGLLLTGGILLHMAISGVLMKPPPWKHKRFQKSKALSDVRNGEASACLLQAKSAEEGRGSLETFNGDCSTKDGALQKKSALNTKSVNSQEFSNVMYGPLSVCESNEMSSDVQKSIQKSVTLKETSCCDNNINTGLTKDICGRQSAKAKSVSDPCDQTNEDHGVLGCSDESTSLEHSPRFEIHQRKLSKHPSLKQNLNGCTTPTEDLSRNRRERLSVSVTSAKSCSDLRGQNNEDHGFLGCSDECNILEDSLSPRVEIHQRKLSKTNVNGSSSPTEGLSFDYKESLSISKSFRILLTSPMFYFITLTNVVFYTCETMFFVTNADFYRDKNVPETDVKIMILFLSICDLIGRLCFGWVTDLKFLSRPHFVALCFLAQGLVFLGFSFVDGFGLLLVLNGVFGLSLGIVTVITCVLPVDYLHSDIQEVAYGAIAFACGVVSLGCSAVIGHFRDNQGSYTSIFYLMSAFSSLTSAFWIFEKHFVGKPPAPSQSIPIQSHPYMR